MLTIGLSLSIFLAALDSSILSTAIPAITTEFGSIASIAWYGSACSIATTAFPNCWGKAYACFHKKLVFFSSVALLETGNVLCATARSSEMLIFGRVVTGLGIGGMMTGAFILIAISVSDQYRAAYMGVVGATFGVASVLGPLIGGGLTDTLGWRWCFWSASSLCYCGYLADVFRVNLPIGGLAVTIMFFAYHSQHPPQEMTMLDRIISLDLGGGLLFTGFLACFILGMHYTGTHAWSHFSVIVSLISSVLFLCLFVFNEWIMGTKAMVQAHLLRKKTVLWKLIYIFFIAGLFFPLQYTLPVQFQSIDDKTASQSGVRLIPLILGVSVFTMVANAIVTYWRHYKALLFGGAILATAGALSIHSVDSRASNKAWVGFELLTGIGVGLVLQIPMIANQASVGAEDVAAVTTLTLFVENTGTALFVATTEAAFTQGLVAHLKRNMSNIDPHAALNAGATQLRHVFVGADLDQVLRGYLYGCRISHVICVACGVVACVISLGSAGPATVQEVKLRLKKSHIR